VDTKHGGEPKRNRERKGTDLNRTNTKAQREYGFLVLPGIEGHGLVATEGNAQSSRGLLSMCSAVKQGRSMCYEIKEQRMYGGGNNGTQFGGNVAETRRGKGSLRCHWLSPLTASPPHPGPFPSPTLSRFQSRALLSLSLLTSCIFRSGSRGFIISHFICSIFPPPTNSVTPH
jgi:hypothetical protein